MKKILIVDSTKEQSMLVRLSVANYKEIKVYEKTSIDEAIDIIEILEDIDVVYCAQSFSSTIQTLVNFLKIEKPHVKLIIHSEKALDYSNVILLDSSLSSETLIGIIKKELGLENSIDLSMKDYIAIPIDYFLYFRENPIYADIYLRIKKSESESHYIKRVQKGEMFDEKDILRFKELQVENFYIKGDQYLDFVDSARKIIIQILGSNKFSAEELIEISHSSYRVTQSMILELGIDNHTYELVKTSIDTMDKVVQEGELKIFLDKLKTNPESFIYNHVYLLSFLLNKVVSNFSWATASIKEKLTYVAFFHDISIQSDHLAMIHSEEELVNAKLSEQESRLVLNHANESSRIIEKFTYLPMGLSNIVKEHHGVKIGSGFTTILNSNLAPLSMVFIVVEDFVQRYLKIPNCNKDQVIEILDGFDERYNKGTYLETVVVLRKLLLQKS